MNVVEGLEGVKGTLEGRAIEETSEKKKVLDRETKKDGSVVKGRQ